jgi:hypothetical protein
MLLFRADPFGGTHELLPCGLLGGDLVELFRKNKSKYYWYAHTPAWAAWLGSLVPGSFGNIDQRILGRSIAAEIALHSREAGEVTRENAAMKKLAAQFNSVP